MRRGEFGLPRRKTRYGIGTNGKRLGHKGGEIETCRQMLKFLLWLILLVLCWPLALLALIAYPFIWLVLLPLRLIGIVVGGVFEVLRAIIGLPARVFSGGPGRASQ